MIRIVLADDHLLFRSMLEEMLKKDDSIDIAASCAEGVEALEQCRITSYNVCYTKLLRI